MPTRNQQSPALGAGHSLRAPAALRKALICSSALAVLAGAGQAAAQTRADGSVVQEVVVTAQRRAERLEDVPMSITALTSESLENAGIANVHDLGSVTPGLQVNFGGAYTQPAIRGVSTITVGTGNENNVAFYVDGFYVSDTQSINSDLVNLENVQVLKGPQGALYGKNATGGAILVNTLAPSKVFTGKLLASYERFNNRRVAGYLSGPIADSIRFSVAGSLRRSDGYIKLQDPNNISGTAGDAAPVKQYSVRTKLQADLSEALTATAAFNYALVSDGRGLLFTPFDYVPATIPGPPLRATEPGRASYNYDTTNLSSTHEATLKLEYKTPIGVLTSYTGYTTRHLKVNYDFDGSYRDLTSARSWSKQRSIQQAVDLTVDAIKNVDLVIGGIYFKDRFSPLDPFDSSTFAPVASGGRTLVRKNYVDLGTDALAAYADATIHFTEALSLSAGGRYTTEKRSISQFQAAANGAVQFPLTKRDVRYNRFTPRATVRYELAPRTNVYASYSKGFRSGAYNAAGAAVAELLIPVKPEDIEAYEVGFKTARSRVRFDMAAFYYDYSNLHVSLTVPDPNCAGSASCGVVTVIGNAPKAEIYGLDAQLTVTPVDRLNVNVGISWLHARYGTFPNAVGTGLNAAATANIPGQVQNWSGKQMARAPTFSGFIGADYTTPLMGGELLLTANLSYTDSYVLYNPSLYGPVAPADLRTKQRYRQDSFTLLNAQAKWTDPSGRYSVMVFGKNLTDEFYWATLTGSTFGDYRQPAAPRTWGVELGYSF